jgi:hypothetical protein
MTALVIFLILSHDLKWEFWAIEEGHSRSYCEMLKDEAQLMWSNVPGNIRVLCVDDRGVEV